MSAILQLKLVAEHLWTWDTRYPNGVSEMSQQQKLDRLKSKPKDFTWSELESLLTGMGYVQKRGSGSRRKFIRKETGTVISLHEPHPRKELKAYQVKAVLEHLKREHQI